LSPKENRDVPPLDYELVRTLKRERPVLEIILNGGLRDLEHARAESAALDGVMLGRAAYQNPALLLDADAVFFADAHPAPSREAAVMTYLPYIERRLAEGAALHAMTRHMLGLFNAQAGGRLWRRTLSEQGVKRGAGTEVVLAALAQVTRVAAEAA